MHTTTTTSPEPDDRDDRAPGEGIDFTTPEGLRQVIRELTDHQAWATSPVAAELMAYAAEKYAPIGRTWHRSPQDAATEAFFAMRTPSTLKARDPWAVVTKAVALSIPAETVAERGLLSQDAARRSEERPASEPVRAGEYAEYLFDVHPHADTPSGGESAVDRVVRATSVFLILTGWPARPVEQAVDYLTYRVCGLRSREAAIETAGGDVHIAHRLGLGRETWRGLVKLMVGHAARRSEPELGLFARILLGDTVPELLADTRLVNSSRALVAQMGVRS